MHMSVPMNKLCFVDQQHDATHLLHLGHRAFRLLPALMHMPVPINKLSFVDQQHDATHLLHLGHRALLPAVPEARMLLQHM